MTQAPPPATDEWHHHRTMPLGLHVEAWMQDGSVRKVRIDAQGSWFTDCTDPMQQAWCDPERVKAWRYLSNAVAGNYAPAMQTDIDAAALSWLFGWPKGSSNGL